MTPPTVGALLGRVVPALDPSVTLAAAAAALAGGGWEALPVVRRGRLLGLVLADDLAAARPSAATTLTITETAGALSRITVESIVRQDVPTIVPTTPVAEAARLLRDGAPPLPVLEGGRVVGLVGVADVLALFDVGEGGAGPELHGLVIKR